MLTIQIVSTQIVEPVKNEKRYVAYNIKTVRDYKDLDDLNSPIIQRRYTHFLNLYNELRKEFPSEMAQIDFPKKAMTGNFDPVLIEVRRTLLAQFLNTIVNESRLREAAPTVMFFQNPERDEAKRLMKENLRGAALTVLENSFKVLNKIYTAVSHPALSTLCRVVACANSAELAASGEQWVNLALARFKIVSDADLLCMYAPLLRAAIDIKGVLGKDKTDLESEVSSLRKRGVKVDGVSLMEAVDKLERVNTW